MPSVNEGSNRPMAAPMSSLSPPHLTPAMRPGSLPILDEMMPMQASEFWAQSSDDVRVGAQVTPRKGGLPTGLLPSFGMGGAAHLPTPQSPSNAAYYHSTLPLSTESPFPQRQPQPQPQQQISVMADPAMLQHHLQLHANIILAQDNATFSQPFITPESSPVHPRRLLRSHDGSLHPSLATPLLSSPFIPRPHSQGGGSQLSANETRPTNELDVTVTSELRTLSPSRSRDITPSSGLGSPFGGHRLLLNDRPLSKAKMPAGSHRATPTIAPSTPARSADASSEAFTSQMSPPVSAPVPQRPLGGEIERIKQQMVEDQAARFSETEARRPDYLVRAQRPSSDNVIDSLDFEEPELQPGLGVTVTPMKGRRIQLFQETSEESFEQSLLAGGYPGYGSMAIDPQTPQPDKPRNALSQRALQWLQHATPGQSGPSNVAGEQDEDWVPSEKEIRKRKRLAAFEEEKEPIESRSKLHPVEIEGKGRVLVNVPPEELPSEVHATLHTPAKKRPTTRRRRRGHRRGRGGSQGEDDELDGPNWLDSDFPWCTRIIERKAMSRIETEERLKWIDRYFESDSGSDSDGEEAREDQALRPAVDPHDNDQIPQPIKRGRGKMVPLKADPGTRTIDTRSRKNVLIPSDPADARAALLSKRSVRALGERRRKREEDESSDEGVVSCPCGRGEDGKPCVQCDDCKCWFHLRCMGYKSESELGGADDPWYCPDCLGIVSSSDPPSEPTFAPTDSALPRDGTHDPLLYQGSPKTPHSSRRDPKTPTQTQTRERGDVFESRSSWNSSGAGPVTPLSTERDIGVYKTPAFDSPFNPADTPSRSGKYSGPFSTPKHPLWGRDTPVIMTSRPERIWRAGLPGQGSAGRDFNLANLGSSRSIYSLDDTPVQRGAVQDERDHTKTLVGRRLWDSPTARRLSGNSSIIADSA